MPSITARALRSQFSSARRPDYFRVAAALARARQRPLTHWTTYDAPIANGRQQTACGEYAALAQVSAEPTCPACRQQLAIYDSLQF